MNTTTFQEKNIHVKGQLISYYDEGDSENVIIFIHGFPFDKNSWLPQIAAMSAEHRLIAFDLRGYGKSTGDTNNMSIEMFADDLLSFIEAKNIEKAIICGISMGGYIALKAALTKNERLKGLILVNTQCIGDSEENKKNRANTIDKIKKEGLKNFAKDYAEKMFGEDSNQTSTLKDEICQVIENSNPNIVISTLEALAERQESCTGAKTISIPTLILAGKHDKVIPLSQSELLRTSIPGSEMKVLDHSGHLCNLEQSEEFNQMVLKFTQQF